MFATGIKIVKEKESYIIVNDSLNNDPVVEVWYTANGKEGFVSMARDDIFADIIGGAYVTNVGHSVISKEQIESAVLSAVHDILPLWSPIANRFASEDVFTIVVENVLHKVAEDLVVQCNTHDITLAVNGGKYFAKRIIVAALSGNFLY